jgi:hypothetical protein
MTTESFIIVGIGTTLMTAGILVLAAPKNRDVLGALLVLAGGALILWRMFL